MELEGRRRIARRPRDQDPAGSLDRHGGDRRRGGQAAPGADRDHNDRREQHHAADRDGRDPQEGCDQKFTPTGAVFDDGSEAELDAIVWATGFHRGIGDGAEGRAHVGLGEAPPKLYRYVFPPDRPGLGYVLACHPIGPAWTVADMQGKYAASVFAGETRLPLAEVMDKRAIQLRASFAHNKVDPFTYNQQIGAEMGLFPPTRSEVLKGLLFDRRKTMRFLKRKKLSRVISLDEEEDTDEVLIGEGMGGPAKFVSKL